MTFSTEGNTHLVPLVKGASSINKGLVLRTYYVTPEKLRKYIQENKERFKHAQIKLPYENHINKFINKRNPAELSELFADKHEEWKSVLDRYHRYDRLNKYKHRKQRLFQNIYAYAITEHDTMLSSVCNMFKKAHANEKFVIQQSEKQVKGKQKSTSSVKEKAEQRAINVHELMPPSPVFDMKKNLRPSDNNAIIDYGTKVQHKVQSIQDFESIELARALSKFINYINPHPRKIAAIMAECSIFNRTSTPECSENFMFPFSVYESSKDFWVDLLTQDHITTVTDNNDYNDDASSLYHSLCLYRLDNAKAKKLFKSYMYPKLEYVLANIPKLHELLYSTKISIHDKEAVLAALPTQVIRKNKHLIDMAIASEYKRDNVKSAMTLFHSSRSSEIDSVTIYNDLNKLDKDMFNIKYGLEEIIAVHKGSENPGINYFLLQLLGAVLLKHHYIPYNTIDDIYGGVFAPRTVVRIYKTYEKQQVQNLRSLINSNKQTGSIKIALPTLNIDTPADGQAFIKLDPFSVFEVYDATKKDKYLAVGTVDAKDVVYNAEGNVVVFNAIKKVKFE